MGRRRPLLWIVTPYIGEPSEIVWGVSDVSAHRTDLGV